MRLAAGTLIAAMSFSSPSLAGSTVVELFTSQSCSSCPPAEAFLGELAERPDLVALEWHVDYWDDLNTWYHGRWQDRFSDPAYTARQRAYNIAIRGTAQVYTPQMVIDGQLEAVGSYRETVEAAIAAASTIPDVQIRISETAPGGIAIVVEGVTPSPASVWLVRFLGREVTAVGGGENHGRTLANHHIVAAVDRLGPWYGGPANYRATAPASQEDGCAVLVQAEDQGPILGAAYCPD